ncbi:outer membrane lipoprotein carrier protein LolA [Ferrovibrio sp.]|uniref:LolA family protein n=1 Tax=Ferrovibrio sp. TaxID=1917215 RepID=UPI0025C61C9F|nr:outer membrane lipoprotein carrier protein LolA [Ferrovibrio sp.]MBX3452958.1 outer membrane lipoprotein carrier protein LolA [Ferrovibrio sp.]
MSRIMDRRRILLAAAASVAGVALLARPGLANTGDDKADLQRIADYFNGVRSLQGRFLQVAPDGGASEGQLHMRRPGRFRFEYDPPAPQQPSPLLIVSDGSFITMEDRQLKSVDKLPLTSTPLDILVRDRVSFDDPKLKVSRLERGAGILRVTLADAAKPQDGRIVLAFTDRPLQFTGWTVVDGQGQPTTISLSKLDFNPELPDSLFEYGPRPAQMRELQRRR